jgi:aryl-alcohol dehydrogenase-like predicted oxidoreductase
MKQGAALPSQQALKWLLARSPNIIVIPGTTSMQHLKENVATWDLI